MKQKYKPLLFNLIFTLGCILRTLLFLTNRDAYDDHITVIQRMLVGLPVGRRDCWECFQPKLYYSIIVFIEKLFPIHSELSIKLIGQGLSVLAGIGTIIIVWIF